MLYESEIFTKILVTFLETESLVIKNHPKHACSLMQVTIVVIVKAELSAYWSKIVKMFICSTIFQITHLGYATNNWASTFGVASDN